LQELTEAPLDLETGKLSIASALGKAIKGASEGDEIEFERDDGRQCKALIGSGKDAQTRGQTEAKDMNRLEKKRHSSGFPDFAVTEVCNLQRVAPE
jgi:hypothetical protein